ncbi:MAG: hypothetical protein AB1Z57_10660 [Acidimicrobiia bacterium]
MAAHANPRPRSGLATALAILLIGVGFAAAWWAVAPTVLGADTPTIGSLDGAYAETVVADAAPAAALSEGVRISTSIQVAQPRDPFRPLVSDGGGGGAVDPGDRLTFGLVSVNEVDGVPRAVVQVDNVEYTVGVGDTFAGNFKVVSLTPSDDGSSASGVFQFGDNTFEASVGQSILK